MARRLLGGATPEATHAHPSTRRNAWLAALTLAPALGVALALPGSGAERIFSLTGATAGCLLCYVIPVATHLRLYFFGAWGMGGGVGWVGGWVGGWPAAAAAATSHNYRLLVGSVSGVEEAAGV